MTTSTNHYCCDASDLGWKPGQVASAVSLFGESFRFCQYLMRNGDDGPFAFEFATYDGSKTLTVYND